MRSTPSSTPMTRQATSASREAPTNSRPITLWSLVVSTAAIDETMFPDSSARASALSAVVIASGLVSMVLMGGVIRTDARGGRCAGTLSAARPTG